jgi:SAM-dependent methyltransferase
MDTRAAAAAQLRGDVDLHLCLACEFIYNYAFDPQIQEFSARYEETQGFSPTFQAFHERLAEDLIERWNLRGKRILEIGCGKGEFLALLCRMGDNEGLGFDPAFVPERNPAAGDERVRYERTLYPPPAGLPPGWEAPDFVCCKMTLEHVRDVRHFVRTIRHGVRSAPRAVVFFQVPDARRIVEEAAFWDVYYEHCSYFTASCLTGLFEGAGFHVLDTWTDYGGQYLMLAAVHANRDGAAHPAVAAAPPDITPGRPARAVRPVPTLGTAGERALIAHGARMFEARVAEQVEGWRARIAEARSEGRQTILWGGGSKAVAFCSAMGASHQPDLVVDMNPHKQGTFLPGTGLEVVSPQRLRGRPDSLVIVMNPLYLEEVRASLSSMEIDWPAVALGKPRQ